MSDRTGFRVYIYECPEGQLADAEAVLRDEYGLEYEFVGEGPDEGLSMTVPIMAEEMPMNSAGEIAEALYGAAPGARWFLWQSPDFGAPGEFCAATPELGMFGPADCDASGQVLITMTDVAYALQKQSPRATAAEFALALFALTGQPWRIDYEERTVATNRA